MDVLRHSGAREREPGIHFSQHCGAMDSGRDASASPRNDDCSWNAHTGRKSSSRWIAYPAAFLSLPTLRGGGIKTRRTPAKIQAYPATFFLRHARCTAQVQPGGCDCISGEAISLAGFAEGATVSFAPRPCGCP